ncbi:MAG TPA: SpoIIE family protein phosphatase [Candidatus Binatia bacterium]|nr:SpoIIE family protein phosphatase [Candidatus Binatia bacterium]
METARADSFPWLSWGVATRTLARQSVSGDLSLVTSFPGGALIAVVDGLGHGEDAAVAARLAVTALSEHAQESVVLLLQRCHEQLKGTRGVVMSLASVRVHDGLLTWAGVGDVEGMLLRGSPGAHPARESLLLRGGVIGYQLPPLHAATLSVRRGDVLILATDGIHSDFTQERLLRNPLVRLAPDGPQQLADHLLARYAKATDDALVLVAQYLGDSP